VAGENAPQAAGEYEIVRYRPSHKSQVAKLQTNLWSSDTALAARYLEWKYEENPYTKDPVIFLAFRGSELVGMRGFYESRWELGSPRKTYPILVADDAAIVPSHRNRRLATVIMRSALEDLARDGHEYIFNLSGSPVTVVSSLAMGWKSAGPLEPISLETGLNLARKGRRLLKRVSFVHRYAESSFLRSPAERDPFSYLDRMTSHKKTDALSVEREPRPDAMADLVSRLGHDGRIRHVRDRDFLAWRFRNPLSVYRFLYWGSSRLEGYLVLKCQHPTAPNPTRVRIVDLEGTSESVRSALLDAAIGLGRFRELFAWSATLSDETRNYLATRGFKSAELDLRVRGCPCVLVRKVSSQTDGSKWMPDNHRLTNLKDWDMRMLYTMAG
jgi:GNAT superfamily N-acetyltransferase